MAVAQVEISLHQLLNALEQLANDYPLDRLAPVQIERIETAAWVLRERLGENIKHGDPVSGHPVLCNHPVLEWDKYMHYCFTCLRRGYEYQSKCREDLLKTWPKQFSTDTDTDRLNWLETYVILNGALMLHDGTHSNFGASGLAFGEAFDDKAFCPNRTLRKAIDECMGIK